MLDIWVVPLLDDTVYLNIAKYTQHHKLFAKIRTFSTAYNLFLRLLSRKKVGAFIGPIFLKRAYFAPYMWNPRSIHCSLRATMAPPRLRVIALLLVQCFPSFSSSFAFPVQYVTRAAPRDQGSRFGTIDDNNVEELASPVADVGRRSALEQGGRTLSALGSLLGASSILSPLPSFADVSDGNVLPQGAAQLSRVIKARAQLQSVAKRVAENSSEIDSKEWSNIENFLRTLYAAGEDMKVMSKGIYEPSKKSKAEDDIKTLQNLIQVVQKPVAQKDAEGFKIFAQKADVAFEGFFEALSDVPDEI